MNAFIELISRIKSETPKFFRILSFIALIFLSITEFGIIDTNQQGWKIGSIIAIAIASLAVNTPKETKEVLLDETK